MPLSIPIFAPLAAGLISAFLPPRWARWLVLTAAVFVLGFAIGAIGDYPSGGHGLTHVTDTKWIPELGIRYSLGVDGLNLFLIGLTALVWVAAVYAAANSRKIHSCVPFPRWWRARSPIENDVCPPAPAFESTPSATAPASIRSDPTSV